MGTKTKYTIQLTISYHITPMQTCPHTQHNLTSRTLGQGHFLGSGRASSKVDQLMPPLIHEAITLLLYYFADPLSVWTVLR